MKFKPRHWQGSHAHILCDRMEDLTHPDTIQQRSKCDRMISLYGYVRGTNLRPDSTVHIPGQFPPRYLPPPTDPLGHVTSGCGDFPLSSASVLPDPCPLPEQNKKRSLNEKEKMIYAPMAGVGGVVYDKVPVYVCFVGVSQEIFLVTKFLHVPFP